MAKKNSKEALTGRDYPLEKFIAPWNEGDRWYGNEKDKAINTPNGTTWDPDIAVHDGYDNLWKGKKK